MTISYVLLIYIYIYIYIYIKVLFLIQFFSFSVFERFKKEGKIRIKILRSTLIVPFHALPIKIFHTLCNASKS